MTIPLRFLRAIVSTHQEPRRLSPRALEMRALILAAAQDMLVQVGRQEITFALLAGALRITTTSLRRHFACMDDLLHTILSDHLDTLFTALEAVTGNTDNLLATGRQAYRAAILDADGQLLAAHRLLLTQAPVLPFDLRHDIAEQCAAIGEAIAPGIGRFALMLLDDPSLPLAEAEEHIALRTCRLTNAPAPHAASTVPAEPDRPPEAPAVPRPMVAVPRTLARTTAMHALFPEDPLNDDGWAATAFQHQDSGPLRARAGP